MRSIRVLHVANSDVGLRNHLGNLMQYQRTQGYAVSAVTHPGRWLTCDTTILDGIPVTVVPFEPRISPVADLRALGRLVRHIRAGRFDIVHTHTVKPGLLGRLAARMARVPVVVHTVHGFYFYAGMAPAEYRLYVAVEKLGVGCSDLILSQNREDIASAIRQRICPPEKLRYLGNGIDLSRFDPGRVQPGAVARLRAEFGIQPGEAVVGFAARLEREKGICEFLDVARLLKSRGVRARYVVVGAVPPNKPGAMAPEQSIAALGLREDVSLLGYRDDMPELLTTMDVVVLPSYGREGIPRILMESAALGRPVVATRVRGVIETVEDGATGILVPAQDGPALADGIAQVLGNPVRAAALGQSARRHALAHFDEQACFRRTDCEYRRLLATKSKIDSGAYLKPVPAG